FYYDGTLSESDLLIFFKDVVRGENKDTDLDGILDVNEITTDIDNWDTNRDGLSDLSNLEMSSIVNDDDADGLSNEEEATIGTNPNNPDTDRDGIWDGVEVNEYNTNPLDRPVGRASQHFEATSAKIPWSGYWWPMMDDGIYEPISKYDQYIVSKGLPDPKLREVEKREHGRTDDTESWWGHCHAWAAASIVEDEPTQPVTANGITFTVGDQKGLLTEIYWSPKSDLTNGGTRYNGGNSWWGGGDVNDIYPKDFHTNILKWIGNWRKAIVADIVADVQVWNHPLYAYSMDIEDNPSDSSKKNVTVTVKYVSDGVDKDYVGTVSFDKTYRYWLKFKNGAIVDSAWHKGSEKWEGNNSNAHPDFLWSAVGYYTPDVPLDMNIIREIMRGGAQQDNVLTLGTPVTGSISANEEKHYKVSVNSGTKLIIKLDGPNSGADFDLYVKKGSKPTTSSYDFRGYTSSADEEVVIDNPSGTYYIMVHGYSGSGTYTLVAKLGTESTDITTLTLGTPISGSLSSSTDKLYYKVNVNSGNKLTIKLDGPSSGADFDLYVKKGSKPTTSSYDARGYTSSADETITINDPSGTYYIMVHRYSGSGTFTLLAELGTESTDITTLTLGTPVSGSLSSSSDKLYYKVNVNSGNKLTIKLDGPNSGADFDLYVKKGSKPTTSSYDARGYTSSADEKITINNPSGTYYIMVYSYSGSGSFKLKATLT
ncbi:MAG: pre-peptidase C-terminal domain-containing protein, partial [Candidatus Thermoplasmatota archaeon]